MELLKRYPIISDQINAKELAVILRECQKVLVNGVEGDIVELGCYVGTTTLFLQRQRLELARNKVLHVYDSFAGLPPKTNYDRSPAGDQFVAGELATTKAQLIRNFKRAHLPLPVIHKGRFSDITAHDMPPSVCFAFLDGDFYSSIMDSLRVIWPKLQPGAVVVVDDYQTEALPGVRQAIKEWSVHHSFTLRVEASLAILQL